MSSLIIASVAAMAIIIMFYLWQARAVAPEHVGNTPDGTPVYVAPEVPVPGIIAPPAAAAAVIAGYTLHPDVQTDGHIAYYKEHIGDVSMLKSLCDALPECFGFTKHGFLKDAATVKPDRWKPDKGGELYVKN